MVTIKEESREIPVVAEGDICVIGGSCTGVFAAVSAARLGSRVLIVENNGFFGGVATAGLVNIWHSLFDIHRERQIIGGLTAEVIKRLEKRNAVLEAESQNYVLNTEELKIELDELISDFNVRPFLHTRFVAPVLTDGKLEGIIIEDKTGRRAIKASYFIDATGDGDLIHKMGLPCCKNDDLQPPTACAIIEGLEKLKTLDPKFSLKKEVFNPDYPEALQKGFLWSSRLQGADDLTMVAGTRITNADCSDADQLTKAEIEARCQVRAICDILRNHVKGGDKYVFLRGISSYIGIRETRHTRCLHTLTETELLNGVHFPDAIANGTYPVDIHHSSKSGLTFRYLDGREVYVDQDGTRQMGRWRDETTEAVPFYQIPYTCLVPEGSENVLVAGRLLDADRGAYGAIRVMVNCNQTGEAAGAASHIALDSNACVAHIDIDKLRQTMQKQQSIII